jgi:hypothetical protein
MIASMSAPRQLVIYADSRHAIGGVPSASLGPFAPTLMADWLVARLVAKPFKNERWFVDQTGRIAVSGL